MEIIEEDRSHCAVNQCVTISAGVLHRRIARKSKAIRVFDGSTEILGLTIILKSTKIDVIE